MPPVSLTAKHCDNAELPPAKRVCPSEIPSALASAPAPTVLRMGRVVKRVAVESKARAAHAPRGDRAAASCDACETNAEQRLAAECLAAEAALHVSQRPDVVTCRDEQLLAIEAFLASRFAADSGGSLYLAGKPGTGKTLTLARHLGPMLAKLDGGRAVIISLNCMVLAEPGAVLRALGAQLGVGGDAALAHVCAARSGPLIVLVLDEVDRLAGAGGAGTRLLYSLFEAAASAGSRLVLIGVCNALDLTSRRLPMLAARGIAPVRVVFGPYAPDDVAAIVRARLGPAADRLFAASALALLARRVCSLGGDLRTALSHAARLLAEGRATPGGLPVAPAAVGAAFCAASTRAGDSFAALPLHQKAVLCAWLAASTDGGSERVAVPAASLAACYAALCARVRIAPESGRLGELCDMLATQGLIRVQAARGAARARGSAYALGDDVPREDLATAVAADALFGALH